MAVKVSGKYVDDDGEAKDIQGSLNVTEWVKSERSPDSDQYWVTNTWYPNRWEFSFGPDLPEEVRDCIENGLYIPDLDAFSG
jgi:hypothetical protein